MTSSMWREIHEQPEAVARTLAGSERLREHLAAAGARHVRRVLFFGRGTSDNAATYGLYAMPILAGLDAASASPSVGTAYRATVDLTGVLAVFISQSGRTAEILDSALWARSHGALTVAITNGPDEALAHSTHIVIDLAAGPEVAVPATKTYTTSLAAVAMLAGVLSGEQRHLDHLNRLPDLMTRTLDTVEESELADMFASHERVILAGRGFSLSAAAEIALKLKETCYVLAMGGSTADLEHGPLAVLDEQTPVVLFDLPLTSPVQNGLDAVADRARHSGAPVLRIGVDGSPGLRLPAVAEPYLPLLLPLPAQRAVERAARARGYDPDSPRGLRKVTQTS